MSRRRQLARRASAGNKPKGKKCKGRGAFGFVTKGACEVHNFAERHGKVWPKPETWPVVPSEGLARVAREVYKWGWDIGYEAVTKFGSDAVAGLK